MNIDEGFKKFVEIMNKELCFASQLLVAVAGGRSVVPFYEKIKEIHTNTLQFFLLDERIPEADRNATDLKNYFSIHEIQSDSAGEYEKKLELISDYLTVDIILAGVGEDGHIASLFPGHELLKNDKRGYAKITDSPKEPKERITLLPESIINSTYIFVFFMGKGKKKAYDFFMKHEPTDKNISKCPALMVKKTKFFVVTDLE